MEASLHDRISFRRQESLSLKKLSVEPARVLSVPHTLSKTYYTPLPMIYFLIFNPTIRDGDLSGPMDSLDFRAHLLPQGDIREH